MFKPEDYALPLEKVLSLRVITDEIDSCSDVKSLQTSLKETTRLLMTYQHLLGTILKEQIHANLSQMIKEETTGDNS
jgi:hypothetical protein